MERPDFTDARPVLIDPFGLGQATVARICLPIYREELDRAAPRAFEHLTCSWGPDLVASAALQTIHYNADLVRQMQAVIAEEAR